MVRPEHLFAVGDQIHVAVESPLPGTPVSWQVVRVLGEARQAGKLDGGQQVEAPDVGTWTDCWHTFSAPGQYAIFARSAEAYGKVTVMVRRVLQVVLLPLDVPEHRRAWSRVVDRLRADSQPAVPADTFATFALQPADDPAQLARTVWTVRPVRGDALIRRGGLRLSFRFPNKGRYDVQAEVPDANVLVRPLRLRVTESRADEALAEVTSIDRRLSMVSFVVAIVTGLWLFYYQDGLAFFGTPTQYIALFLWAFGIDRTTKSLSAVRASVEGR